MHVKNKIRSLTLALIVCFCIMQPAAGQSVLYVDANSLPGGNGLTWGTAYKYLQDALAAAEYGDEIWVAEGIYKPDQGDGITPGDRTATFQLLNGVAICGGFPSGGGRWEDRHLRIHETILSGDLDSNDVGFAHNTENSFHVVNASNANSTAILEGFTVTAGNADDYSRLNGCGGGMYSDGGNPTILNSVFSVNSARMHGGGIYNRDNSNPTLINCVFSGNKAGYGGGVFNSFRSNSTFINCTFSSNSAGYGLGMANSHSDPRLTNCVLWGNKPLYGTGEYSQIDSIDTCWPVVNFCCIEGWTGDLSGVGNIATDPMFVRDPYSSGDGLGVGGKHDLGDLHLMRGSPCIDAGNNDALPEDTADLDGDGDIIEPIPLDIAGYPRIAGSSIDMGAYEGPHQGFVIITDHVTIPEGETATFTIRLAMKPNSPVYVTVSHHSGDQDILVQSGQTLMFDSSNFGIPQVVTLAAAEDLDSLNGTATILVSAENVGYSYVIAKESENDVVFLFVDANIFPGGDGLSWDTAFNDLQDALDYAATIGVAEIWVAMGSYKPDRGTGNQQAAFHLVNNVKVYGGFPPGGGNWEQRNPKVYETILSGDLAGNDVQDCALRDLLTELSRAENSYNVVIGSRTDATAVLDGFTITAGNAIAAWAMGGGGMLNDFGSPMLINCIFSENSGVNQGGGMSNRSSRPSLINCIFTRNWGQTNSGGMWNWDSNPTLIGCVFSGNASNGSSGGMDNQSSSPNLTNCVIIGNSTNYGYCGGMWNYDNSNPTMTNCILWNNTAMHKFQIELYYSCTLTVSYSNIQGGQAGVYVGDWSMLNWGDGNIDTNPLLTPKGHLRAISSCIDAGNNAALPNDISDVDRDDNTNEPIPLDIDGDNRIIGAQVDMGADEFLDSDGDRLPDWWEQKYFGDPNAADPNDDPDGDRIINLDEYELYSSSPTTPPYWVNNKRGNDAYNGMSHNPRGDGVGPKKTIQAAIDAATDGDTILVTPGTYTGSDNRDIDFGGKAIVLRSLSGSAPSTIIDCGGLGRAFYFHSGETAATAVVGFIITNGLAYYGGAIRCERSNPQIRNCVVIDSTSKPVVRTVTLEPHEIPVPGGGYYWDGYDFSDQTKTGEYGGDFYYNGLYFGALSPARQRGVMDVGPVALTSIDPIPESGYSRLVKAIVGHSYIALAQEGEEGYYILFTVTAKGKGFITIDWLYVNGRIWPLLPGGGIFCRSAFPTLDNCVIRSNSPDGAWMEHGGARIEGTVGLSGNDLVGNNLMLYGDGTLQIDPSVTLDLTDARIRCDIVGPGTIQVDLDSELIVESDAIIDLYNEADPSANGQFLCDGLLRLRDNATVIDAQVYVSRASFEDNAIILNSVITAEAGAPFGQFFIEDSVQIWLDYINADGDRYLDLNPIEFDVNNIHIDIVDVNITEGTGGSQGGLFELRGAPDLVNVISCDPENQFFCQAQTIPPFDTNNWAINRLELVEGAKLNLTNRFYFQEPYDSGGDDEVLYVKELILRSHSVLNTAFNHIYYETLVQEPYARIINVPLLGFSLNNISFDDENDYLTRVKHNNFISPDPDKTRIHVKRVVGEAPDPNGMMQMQNLTNTDTGYVVNARAKGLFAKSSEDLILIQFEYLFCDPDPNSELVIYLSDTPELLGHNDPYRAEHYIEVARLAHPPLGRPGSFSSGRFGVFYKEVSKGHLDFIRGTRMELELIGPEGTCILINNWDPGIRCSHKCMDVAEQGDPNYPQEFVVNAVDFLAILSECGNLVEDVCTPSGYAGCLESLFSKDGVVTIEDAMAVDLVALLNDCVCPQCASESSLVASISGTEQLSMEVAACIDEYEAPLLVAGKRYDSSNSDFMSDRLYGFDEEPNFICGPCARDNDRLNGQLIRDYEGNLYQLNLQEGLVRLYGSNVVVVVPNGTYPVNDEPRYGLAAEVYLGRQAGNMWQWQRPILDAAFDKDGSIYVVPVVVKPLQPENPSYIAAARLELDSNSINVVHLYDPLDSSDNLNPDGLREIEVDDESNVYILNAYYHNEGDRLLVYDTNSSIANKRLYLAHPNNGSNCIYTPAAMHVSNTTGRLYLASSLNDPNATSTLLYMIQYQDYPNNVETIEITGMGHITDITEDPVTGTIWVIGYSIWEIPNVLAAGKPDEDILDREPFYKPYIAKIPCGNNGAVNAVCLSNNPDPNLNLALPLSIVWTGATSEKCDGADLDGTGEVNFDDFAILTSHWQQAPGIPSADIYPRPCGDGIVNLWDLAILVDHWLESGCNGNF